MYRNYYGSVILSVKLNKSMNPNTDSEVVSLKYDSKFKDLIFKLSLSQLAHRVYVLVTSAEYLSF